MHEKNVKKNVAFTCTRKRETSCINYFSSFFSITTLYTILHRHLPCSYCTRKNVSLSRMWDPRDHICLIFFYRGDRKRRRPFVMKIYRGDCSFFKLSSATVDTEITEKEMQMRRKGKCELSNYRIIELSLALSRASEIRIRRSKQRQSRGKAKHNIKYNTIRRKSICYEEFRAHHRGRRHLFALF